MTYQEDSMENQTRDPFRNPADSIGRLRASQTHNAYPRSGNTPGAYQARCSCGWTGAVYGSEVQADDDAAEHMRDQRHPGECDCEECEGPFPVKVMTATHVTIAGLIGQRVVARSPQTGRRFTGEVIGQQFTYPDGIVRDERDPIAIVRLDDGGSLMRVFLHCIKLDEEGATWLR